MRVSSATIVASLLLALTTGVSLPVRAMYAEQAGVDDWFWKGVGDVSKAVYHPPSKSLKSVYTLTKDGSTVASIKTKSDDGEIRWKRNFAQAGTAASSDPIVCLSAGESVVVTGSKNGIFTFLNPKDGVPTFTAKLPKAVTAAKEGQESFAVKDCSTDEKGNTLTIVLQSGATIRTVTGNTESSLDNADVKSKTFSGAIKRVAGISQTQVWVQLEKGAIVAVPLSDISVGEGLTIPHTADHPASIQTVGPVFTVVKQDDGLLKTYTVSADNKKLESFVITTEKTSPGALHGMTLVGAQESNPESLLAHEIVGESLELSVGDHTVKLNSLDRPGLCKCLATTRILAAKTTKKGTSSSFEALIKTSDGHLTYIVSDKVAWSRPEGLSQLAAIEFSEHANGDKFGFDQLFLAGSSKGRVYSYRTVGPELQWSVDWLSAYLKAGGKQVRGSFPTLKGMEVVEGGLLKLLVVVEDSTAGQIFYSVADGSLSSVLIVPQYAALLGDSLAKRNGDALSLAVAGQTPKATESFYYTVDQEKGIVQGFAVAANSQDVTPTWTVNLRQPLVSAVAGTELGLLTAETLRSFPNRTSKLMEVKTKYGLMANILVVARLEQDEEEEEMPTLHLTAINTLTGAIVGSMKHADVDGEVKISIVEHYVLYHYMCVKSMRYYVGVWELFERADLVITEASLTNPAQVAASAFSKQKKVSSFNNRAPLIAAQSLLFPSDVALMGPAVSLDGIARKAVIIVTKSGEVVSVPLRSLSFGFKDETFPDPIAHPQKQVVYPSQKILSYKHNVQQPKLLVTEPTLLESTSHVVVAGQDIFYTRSSLGKPFDVLNDDFGKEPLIIGTVALAVATLVARHFSAAKTLNLQWA